MIKKFKLFETDIFDLDINLFDFIESYDFDFEKIVSFLNEQILNKNMILHHIESKRNLFVTRCGIKFGEYFTFDDSDDKMIFYIDGEEKNRLYYSNIFSAKFPIRHFRINTSKAKNYILRIKEKKYIDIDPYGEEDWDD